ncbi:Heparan sulfate glucosamine 3-O-sulfotransferase 5 [Papilio xuthus]|uniref:Heparan sulfate glucosamine 3-O-sulfotransferase 5 n=1 Tax=Papilio xuthus TaxID=66420 RepID=A0A194PFU8_PAPXU|nr:Heparan sulfate glucosamine 3-O-sulfotransferase 5 [Papilio xuthus]
MERVQMNQSLPGKYHRAEASYKSCSQSLPLDILWLPRSSFRPAEGELADCVLVVGVSRPKLAAALLSVTLLSLFLTFHVLYDSSEYGISGTYMSLRKRLKLPRPPRPVRRLPQALIIGVRKCGTRALLEMLYLHPMVQKASGEVHFFDRDENYALGLDWYRSKMPLSFKGQITIEKSPSYFVTPEVPERVRAMNSSVRLLLIVREPVTRAISDYTQLRSRATPSAPAHALVAGHTPHQALDAAKPFEHLAISPDGSINVAYRPIAISLYHAYLHRWLEVFPREQILVVNGDQLIEDPVPQLRRIEKFLGLEHKIGRKNFYFNETKGFYCLRNDTTDKCLRETKGRKHPRVDPAVVTKLRKFFVQHNQRFYDLVGEDLGWPED